MIAAEQPDQPAAEERKRGAARFESDEKWSELGASPEDLGDLRGLEMMEKEIGDDDVCRFRLGEIFEHVLCDLIFPPAEPCNRRSRLGGDRVLLVHKDNGDAPPMSREATAESKHQAAVARAKFDDPPRRIDSVTKHATSHDARVQHYCIEEPKVAARPHGGRIIGRQNIKQLSFDATGRGHCNPSPSSSGTPRSIQHRLGDEAGPERHGAAGRVSPARVKQSLQDEHDAGG
jgi:hypothetical protein